MKYGFAKQSSTEEECDNQYIKNVQERFFREISNPKSENLLYIFPHLLLIVLNSNTSLFVCWEGTDLNHLIRLRFSDSWKNNFSR